MDTTTKKPKGRVFIDPKGNEIPSGFVHKTDRLKHDAALRLSKRAAKLSEQMAQFKNDLLKVCDELYDKTVEEARVTRRQNSKGSYTISTIDKAVKIEVTVQDTISFNDNISLAHEVIMEYLTEVTKNSAPEITQLITHAFETKKGKLDVKRIMGLMRLEINHPKWLQGIELIKKAIETNTSKRYVRIWQRKPEGGYNSVKLDFASI